MLTNLNPTPMLIRISQPNAPRHLLMTIASSYLCGRHQAYQQSDLLVVHPRYHHHLTSDRDPLPDRDPRSGSRSLLADRDAGSRSLSADSDHLPDRDPLPDRDSVSGS